MSEENEDSGRFNLSRRKALAGLGSIGIAGAIGGLGTSAAFNDEESVSATVTAGELDLKLDYLNYYNGQVLDGSGYEGSISDSVNAKAQVQPGQTDGELILNLQDVKPGDSGCTVISIHMDPDDGNPAFVWMQANSSASENGTNEAEGSTSAETAGQVELLDALQVNAYYDNSYDCEFNPPINDDGNFDSSITAPEDADMTEDGNPATGPRTPFRTLTDTGIASDKGILLDGVRGTGILSRKKAAAGSTDLWLSPFFPTPSDAKAELEVDANFSAGDPSNRQKVANNLAVSASDLQNLDSDTSYAGEPSDGFVTNPVSGQTDIQTGTQFIAFEWEIPFDTGNEIQSDSVSIDLKLHAQQARHNQLPLSPFNSNANDSDREPNFAVDLVPEVDPDQYYLNPYGF